MYQNLSRQHLRVLRPKTFTPVLGGSLQLPPLKIYIHLNSAFKLVRGVFFNFCRDHSMSTEMRPTMSDQICSNTWLPSSTWNELNGATLNPKVSKLESMNGPAGRRETTPSQSAHLASISSSRAVWRISKFFSTSAQGQDLQTE